MKKSMGAGAACLAVILTLGTIPASARDLPANGLSRSDVVSWLQSKGYQASIQHDAIAQDDYVASASGGVNWGVYFYGCDGGVCKDIQYSAGWGKANIDVNKINSWNRDQRYIRAYNNEGGDVFGEYDVDVSPGGSWEQLDHSLTRWDEQLVEFKKYLGE
jgi:hypothetical protein